MKDNSEAIDKQIKKDLKVALLYFSKCALEDSLADELVAKYWEILDWDNKYLGHKGINWIAKKILEREGLR